ncbi:MAG: 16S rRNA (adenine(1518)-N(6)/adenine(1519)-N(6))-dimethyltransferase RsmA [Acidobacteriota bacterium]|nr:16S rRNA (adenine(1518)-N(6)/adenine(1519)-N(6))-dimethyltransferase RsmA [Acidobacteriota bacterium]MDE3222241.1 16S rRNA (adenine(1518)-N(6)/adenine(1519)-N(6))-dimethyltransferase RsmA [Acidobacteriota bacterium]
MVTHSRAQITDLLTRHGLKPSRALGQNFVVDANTVRRVARLAEVGPGDFVLEIGAGLGSLTLALVETGATVEALEVDRYLLAALDEVVAPLGVVVHHVDALRADYDTILTGRDTVIVANLPYNVATPLIMHLLEHVPLVKRLLVMVQYEVGERLAARAGDEAYGAASVRVQYFAEARVVGKVPPTVFVPKPHVDSALVAITRRDRVLIDPSVVSDEALFEVVRTAFAQRRKMLRRSLAEWASEGVFERAGVDATRRPEELTIEEFASLAAAR